MSLVAADGKAVYGCTEFVFFDTDVLAQHDPAAVLSRIAPWLPLAPVS
jgi:hypothetical protein